MSRTRTRLLCPIARQLENFNTSAKSTRLRRKCELPLNDVDNFFLNSRRNTNLGKYGHGYTHKPQKKKKKKKKNDKKTNYFKLHLRPN